MDHSTEAVPNQKDAPVKKTIKLLLKIGITLVCFWYISQKINWQQATQALADANWWYLFLAVLLYLLSKVLSSFRLNFYFRNIGLNLPELTNGKLYWMGMFYNLFLPGAISGDAYKVVLLHKRYGAPYKKASAAVLLDRFSGLLALGVLLAAYGLIVVPDALWDGLFIAGAIGAIIGLYLVIRFFFPDFLPSFWPAFFWGLAVQGVQVVCLYAILAAIGQPLLHAWIFISLVATVISVLPISLGGGLGTRELVFAEGAGFFGLDPAIAVVISLLFYFCNLVTSVWGVYYTFHDPLVDRNTD
ncbi:hypothetical protein SAMN05444008_106241 [Cnuella takakiae]|uniref:Lysylphosphatidylglycerol synthase TM region n=1 Tax=Cnuella takakiae TaxID=1302690 RepID=A0A1M5AFA0_9BACT|nr:lysylphosphatidylglycerol synthase transmembrane domain-containing protein [Cnuella takakiae]OLY91984.1 hypothetical protein BUE76_08800 [Cnuella takakiae]SHF28970.1 hypothetical protein SAMN05444008_106241 [Cnuella takakiae]